MNANRDLDRRLSEYFAAEAPNRAPDRVLGASLDSIDTTPQRRVVFGVPWRIQPMNTYAKVALAAVAVVVVAFGGIALLRPSSPSGTGGAPSPTPKPTLTSPTTSPSGTPISSTDERLDTSTWVPFRSERYGYRDAAPAGWQVNPATKFWIVPEGPDTTKDEWDELVDPVSGMRFWSSSIRLPAGVTFEAWAAAYHNGQVDASAPAACDPTKQVSTPVTIDDTEGVLRVGCRDVESLVVKGGLVYSFAGVEAFNDTPGVTDGFRALYDAFLTTIVLDPASALVPPSPSPR